MGDSRVIFLMGEGDGKEWEECDAFVLSKMSKTVCSWLASRAIEGILAKMTHKNRPQTVKCPTQPINRKYIFKVRTSSLLMSMRENLMHCTIASISECVLLAYMQWHRHHRYERWRRQTVLRCGAHSARLCLELALWAHSLILRIKSCTRPNDLF